MEKKLKQQSERREPLQSMEIYIVRIHWRDRRDHRKITGEVETFGPVRARAFANIGELEEILGISGGTGEMEACGR
jgi:hypothetical protein